MASTAEDYLIDSFHFKIPPGASYVTGRRSVSYFTAGSNTYTSGSGAKLIRISLAGDGWLDPGRIILHYTLANTDTSATNNLRTIGGPWSFCRRVRGLAGGSLVNCVPEMLQISSTNNNRDHGDVEGFGYRWGRKDNYI